MSPSDEAFPELPTSSDMITELKILVEGLTGSPTVPTCTEGRSFGDATIVETESSGVTGSKRTIDVIQRAVADAPTASVPILTAR